LVKSSGENRRPVLNWMMLNWKVLERYEKLLRRERN